MLITDNRKEIPLDTSRLDWAFDKVIIQQETDTAIIPLRDPALDDTIEQFAYEIGACYPWAWPDMSRTTAAIQVDMSRSYFRFSLLVNTAPYADIVAECGEWSEFEKRRNQAAQECKDKQFNDTIPLVLTEEEEWTIRRELYDRFGLY